ncbi:MAG: CpXC domain-containing protein [Hydrogeniiclostridium sp.]
MSTEIRKEVCCPDCGTKTTARMWSGINAEVNPNLRLSVLDESLFDWRCPQCGYEAMLAYPCLYHDKGRRFMIYILPGKPDPAKAAGIGAQFPQLRGVRKRVTGSLATLKEKILLFEDGLDDRAAELVKLLLAMVLERGKGKRVEQGFYCSSDEAADRIGFSFFVEGEEEPVRRMTSFAAYRQALSIVQNLLPPDGEEFLVVNEKYARDLLYRYRHGGEPPQKEQPDTAGNTAEPAAAAAEPSGKTPETNEETAQASGNPAEPAETAPQTGAQAQDAEKEPSAAPEAGVTEESGGEPSPEPQAEHADENRDEAAAKAQDAPKTEMGE